MAYTRLSVEGDVFELAPRLRKEDVDECVAVTGIAPALSLLSSFVSSKLCFSVVDDDERVIAMWGVCPVWDDFLGGVWMLGTNDIFNVKTRFLRESREWVGLINNIFPVLFNFVDERNTTHIRWLRWCGFTFIKRHPEFGVEKRPFIEFVRIKPCASP